VKLKGDFTSERLEGLRMSDQQRNMQQEGEWAAAIGVAHI
jgi:hypothetical protein